ncbi:MAG TPA: glycoside hydrolase family 15 protein [Candidatus Limnocylindrales bacterium]|nr:glycoside hydrolase family 15 protein [Candidatus Limnocylindrales bacterium]
MAAGELREYSRRRLLAAQDPGGAFVASPTFEQYRYAWLRDGAFIAYALSSAGEVEAADRFHAWVGRVIMASAPGIERAIAAAPSGRSPSPADYLHCRYTLDGAHGPADWPTFQLDGPGIWLWALAERASAGPPLPAEALAGVLPAARYLAALWQVPSHDAWEEHPDRIHTSTLGAALAGLRAAEALGAGEPALARAAREIEVQLAAMARPHGHLTKWSGTDEPDASLLWLGPPLYRLYAPDDPAWLATIEVIEGRLRSPHGGVYRYIGDTYYGGGEWVLLCASLGLAQLSAGGDRGVELARRSLDWIEQQADGAGDLPEQVACHAQQPERIDEWVATWGPSARPLTWSHAMYLLLADALERQAG